MEVESIVPESPYRHLRVWAVTKHSYYYVWHHRARFYRPLFLVFLWFFVCDIAEKYFGGDEGNNSKSIIQTAWEFCAAVAKMMLGAALAVGIHRSVLLGEVRRGIGLLYWNRDFRRYLATLLTIFFVSWAPLFLAAVPSMILLDGADGWLLGALIAALIAGFVWMLLSLRLTLALPATVLGDHKVFALAWRATRGNTWRIIATNLLVTLPIDIVSAIGDTVSQPVTGGTVVRPTMNELPDIGLSSLADTISASVYVVSLSLSYEILVRGERSMARADDLE